MKWFFAVVLYIIAAALALCGFVGVRRKRSERGGKLIRMLMFSAAASIAANASGFLAHSPQTAAAAYGFGYIFSDLMLILLLTYAYGISGFKRRASVKIALHSAAAVDAVLMIANIFTGIAFECSLTEDGLKNEFYAISAAKAGVEYHIALLIVFSLFIIWTLARKNANSPRIYRGKYKTLLLAFVLCAVSAVISGAIKCRYDFSLIFDAGFVFLIFYLSALYVPKGLIERLLSFVAANMDDGIICFDLDGRCIFANNAARIPFNAENDLTVFGDYYDKWAAQRDLDITSSITAEETYETGGGTRSYITRYSRLVDNKGVYIGCFFQLHDNTDEKKSRADERYKATHDMLTGIYNKEFFCERTAAVLKENPDVKHCIVCSDIKNFKLVNDMFGVDKGDEILRTIADALGSIAGENAVYGRISGDRFAMCMPLDNFSEEAFLREAEKIGDLTGNDIFRIHMHFGVYKISNPNMQVTVMCDRARLAIETIKTSYQDIISYYDQDLREKYLNEQQLTGEFDEALATGQFKMYLQPQISAENGNMLGAEALVRWVHPERGLIPPDEFIGIFERTGLISRLDMYIWECACKQLKLWSGNGKENCHISVNISPKDFFFTDVYEVFTGLVTKYGVSPKRLKLEITETAIMTDLKKQLDLIDRLRDYGFTVEIDDFGSGYSSLNTLKDMTVDTLKIDMGFLRKTENRERSQTILRMIITLSKHLGMEVITEGVETREQVDFLTEFGCDVFQGYYFAKPMAVDDFEKKYFKESALRE